MNKDDKDEKTKEYYKKYSKNYYQLHKDKFKKYYETYKQNKLEKQQGTFVKPVKPKKTKRELNAIKWERKVKKNEQKRLAFIEKLKNDGFIST
jgi:hypothetical protein